MLFFDFLHRCRHRLEVGHRSNSDKNVALSDVFHDGRIHLIGADDIDDGHSVRYGQRDWARDEQDSRTRLDGRFSQCITLFARTVIADVAYWVDGFSRRAGSDHHGFARQELGGEERAGVGDDVGDI